MSSSSGDRRLVLVEFETTDFESWVGGLEATATELGIEGLRLLQDATTPQVVDVTFPVDGDAEARRLGRALSEHPAVAGEGVAVGRFIGAPRMA